jgi:hypothetical protein
MTEQPEYRLPESDSLEVRWFVHGQLERAVSEWFARFPAELESREDTYLLHPHQRRVSVKLRGSGALDVKVYHGSPGILDVPDRACGRMERWQKWSFPCDPLGQVSGDLANWALVRKRRRISRFPLGSTGARMRVAPRGQQQPGCSVELTEIHTGGEPWWSLGFEAVGQAGLLRGKLQAAVGAVFSHALPDDFQFRLDDSRSYAKWLSRTPDAESDADAWISIRSVP